MTEAAVDASPLIFLSRAGQLPLLKLAAAQVHVPTPVLQELSRGPDDQAIRAVEEALWLGILPEQEIPPEVAGWSLGFGESSVLAWCLKAPGRVAIIDDLSARRCAEELGIPLRGTLGLVLLAKRRGIITAARPLLEELRRTGMYLSDRVLDRALARVGE